MHIEELDIPNDYNIMFYRLRAPTLNSLFLPLSGLYNPIDNIESNEFIINNKFKCFDIPNQFVNIENLFGLTSNSLKIFINESFEGLIIIVNKSEHEFSIKDLNIVITIDDKEKQEEILKKEKEIKEKEESIKKEKNEIENEKEKLKQEKDEMLKIQSKNKELEEKIKKNESESITKIKNENELKIKELKKGINDKENEIKKLLNTSLSTNPITLILQIIYVINSYPKHQQ